MASEADSKKYVVVEPLSSEQKIYKELLFYQKNKENLIVK